jgi:hypothetical protein
MHNSSSNRTAKYAGALILAATLAAGTTSVAMAQPADPNYQQQVQDYQQKQQQYQQQQQEYDAKQIAHAQAQDAYADKRTVYQAQKGDYEAQKRDYERARADYDARYGDGAFDTYARTYTTTKTYVPAGGQDGTVTVVHKEVVEH